LKGLSETRGFTDDMLGTVTGKIINGATLAHMKLIKPDVVVKLESDMKESKISSNLMEGFPPICKQDPLDVKLFYIDDHLQSTGEEIRLEDIPEVMYGGKVKLAKSRKNKRKPVSEAEYLEGASKQPPKAKKSRRDSASKGTTSGLPTIQEEAEDLQPDQILAERTRSGKTATISSFTSEQPTIPKKKRKHMVRKLKESKYIEAEEEASELVIREVRRKPVNDEAVQRAVELASQIIVPASSLLKEDIALAASQVVEAAVVIQDLAASEAEVLGFVEAAETREEISGTSEAAETSEPHVSMSDALTSNVEIVELGSSSETLTNSPASSSSSSILSSSNEDDVPLSKMYSSINKTTSKATTSQKPDNEFEPMYPSVEERLTGLQQRCIDACKHLPADHPLQPPMIDSIQFVPADAEGGDDSVGGELTVESNSLSKPKSPINQNLEIAETSILSNLETHYSGELSGYVSNLQTASDIASDEVMTESPQQQLQKSPSNTCVLTSAILVPELSDPEQTTPEQSVPEHIASE